MNYLERVEVSLAAIRAQDCYRSLDAYQVNECIDFSSNDYLGLSTDPQVVQAFRSATRVGSGGARLLGGRHREHSLLEEELAEWLGRERALLFSSGYHAALGAITVLGENVDRIFSDRLNHASLIDGMRLARAPRTIYPHVRPTPRAGRAANALLVTESIFSMDGDAADLAAMAGDLGDGDVLLVDEAHALGVAGPRGAGLARDLRDPRVVVMGTLSKSLGALGGFVAGPAPLIELLINSARPFIFDTALPPAIALAARVALALARRDERRRERLHAAVLQFRNGLRAMGLPIIQTPSPIVPVVLGKPALALHVSAALLAKRIYAPAIRPPTVPDGSSRLRFSLRADHTPEHIDLALRELQRCIATS
ncbi:MAG: aminotransferase class I/II-fold pyridoxal phosphate-dependent enzyme [Vulcanimicrobiaceae bacterium]